MALTLPLESTLTLMAMSQVAPQIRNKQTGEVSVDSITNEPIYQLDVAMSIPGGKPLSFQLAVPKSGIDPAITEFTPFHAIGLIFMTGEKNNRTWQMFRCSAITPLVTAAGAKAA